MIPNADGPASAICTPRDPSDTSQRIYNSCPVGRRFSGPGSAHQRIDASKNALPLRLASSKPSAAKPVSIASCGWSPRLACIARSEPLTILGGQRIAPECRRVRRLDSKARGFDDYVAGNAARAHVESNSRVRPSEAAVGTQVHLPFAFDEAVPWMVKTWSGRHSWALLCCTAEEGVQKEWSSTHPIQWSE